MTEQVQDGARPLDTVKLVAAAVVLVGGIALFYVLSTQPIWVRWLIVLAAFAASVFVALQSHQGKAFGEFVQSSRVELRKVVWPNRQETWQTTAVIFVLLIILGLFFWGLDFLLGSTVTWLTGRGA